MNIRELIVGAGFLGMMALAAEAEPFGASIKFLCDRDLDKIQTNIATRYGEQVFFTGTADGTVAGEPSEVRFTMYMSPTTGSWTMVRTQAGVSCIVGVGNEIEFAKPGEAL